MVRAAGWPRRLPRYLVAALLCSCAVALTPVYHVCNLSNGIEALPALQKHAVPLENVGFMRLQSSHAEAQAFDKILLELDHNLLVRLALGHHVLVYDVGSRAAHWPDGNKWVPRALWWGLPWVQYVLNDVWNLEPASATTKLRGYNVNDLFRKQLFNLPKSTRKRLKYYRTFVATEHLRLFGAYRPGGTAIDGNKEAYRQLLLHYMAPGADAGAALPADILRGKGDPEEIAAAPVVQQPPSARSAGAAPWWDRDLRVAESLVADGFLVYNPHKYMNVGRSRTAEVLDEGEREGDAGGRAA